MIQEKELVRQENAISYYTVQPYKEPLGHLNS